MLCQGPRRYHFKLKFPLKIGLLKFKSKYLIDEYSNNPFQFKYTGASYDKLVVGKACSSLGLKLITTESECKDAANKLELKWGYTYSNTDSLGCYHAEDGNNNVRFNKATQLQGSAMRSKYAAICHGIKIIIILYIYFGVNQYSMKMYP